jgi:hypothetical protein
MGRYAVHKLLLKEETKTRYPTHWPAALAREQAPVPGDAGSDALTSRPDGTGCSGIAPGVQRPAYRLMVRPHPGLSGSGRASRFTSRGTTPGCALTVLVCSVESPAAAFSRFFPALLRKRPVALRKRPIAGS